MPIDNEIARNILAYLVEHPKAQDTLEGIMQWWLLEQEIKFQKEKVREAIADLVGKGLILERKGGKSHVHYRINQRMIKGIRTILKKDIVGKK